MNRPRRLGILVAGLAAVTLAASACGGGSSGDAQGTAVPGADALTKAEGVTAITFWHSMKSATRPARSSD